MRKVLWIVAISVFSAVPTYARCDGGSCSTCTNCSRCYHCNRDGGSCSVCVGGGSTAGSGSSSIEGNDTFILPDPTATPRPLTREEELQWAREMEQARIRRAQKERRDAARAVANERAIRDMDRRFWAERRAAVRPTTYPTTKPTASCCDEAIVGKCISVKDGDTIEVLWKGKPVRVRLNGIDAPEKAQPFGEKSKQFASQTTFGKQVTVYPTGVDRYKRTLGWVFIGKTHVNAELVRAGLAWHYKQYAPKETKLAALEVEARAAKRGLWADANAIAPWEWRRGKRLTAQSTLPPVPQAAVEFSTPAPQSTLDWRVLVPIGFVAIVGWALFRPRQTA